MKSGSHFHFKQFSIAHDRSAHKVGTDGVLLGAWVDLKDAKQILDVGTGTAVIALMIAQRTPESAAIDAIEMEEDDANQAMENVRLSPWPEKITVHHIAIQDFAPQKKYDLVVSNPPYFINSAHPPEHRRTKARHTEHLTFDELIEVATRLLHPTGRLAVVLPHPEGKQFIEIAISHGLFPLRHCEFRSRKHKPIERLLLEFSRQDVETRKEELILYGMKDEWSADYTRLTRDFYLKT